MKFELRRDIFGRCLLNLSNKLPCPLKDLKLGRYRELMILDLSCNNLRSCKGLDLTKNINLNFLFLSENKIKDLSLLDLTKNRCLWLLDLSYNHIKDVSGLNLENNTRLEWLDLEENTIEDLSSLNLENNTRLEELNLTGNTLTLEQIAELKIHKGCKIKFGIYQEYPYIPQHILVYYKMKIKLKKLLRGFFFKKKISDKKIK